MADLNISIQWKGDELGRVLSKEIGGALFASAKKIADAAKARAATFADEGEYENTIKADQGGVLGSIAGIFSSMPRASFVRSGSRNPRRPASFIEMGTGRTPAHPTILPAYDSEKSNLTQRLTDIL